MNIENKMSKETYKALVKLTSYSKSSIVSHSLDMDKWNEFIISIFENDPDTKWNDVESWLKEQECNENEFVRLNNMFEDDISLLKYCKKKGLWCNKHNS